MLDEQQIREVIAKMWQLHLSERGELDRVGDFARGRRGVPEVPEGSGQEVKDLARLSVKNILGVVVDSFAQNLSVTGYRTAASADNDPGWALWQANRVDARQALVHIPALTYGAAYVTVTRGPGGSVRLCPRGPKDILTAYVDPLADEWPQFAVEIWRTQDGAKLRRKANLYDDQYVYPLDLGEITEHDPLHRSATNPITPTPDGDPVPHGAVIDGAPVVPVVRFVNAWTADGQIVGEVAPLIPDQLVLNTVNFDRLIVSRFGAFPQKVISGWSGSKNEVLAASAMRVWAFEDPEVKATALPSASTGDYNAVLEEIVQHIALRAGISLANVTGKLVNVSAEALAAAEANQQRKLAARRESFGESWEQVLRLAAAMDGDEATASDSGAEVVWRDTEARAFAAVVDGIAKLATAGIPLDQLVPLVPGLSQQQVQGIKTAMRTSATTTLVDRLLAAPAALTAPNPAPSDADVAEVLGGATGEPQQSTAAAPVEGIGGGGDPVRMKAQADAMGVMIRAGVKPEIAAARVGLAGLEFLDGRPITLKYGED